MRKGIAGGLVFVLAITLVVTVMAQRQGQGSGTPQGQYGSSDCQAIGGQMRHGAMHGQGRGQMAGQGTCPQDCQGFDPANMINLSGAVEKVDIAQGQGFPNVVVKTAEGKILTVVVGPYWLLEKEKFEIRAGDALMISGFYSKTKADTLVAVEITRNSDNHIVLRNEQGKPMHAGCPGACLQDGTCPHGGTCPHAATCPNPNCPRK